jgi:hypothetical protein
MDSVAALIRQKEQEAQDMSFLRASTLEASGVEKVRQNLRLLSN